MLVDHERAWLGLKRVIAEKSHHGQRDLLAVMAQLELDNQLEEGLPERALRLYGVVFSNDLLAPSHPPRVGDGDATEADALRPDSTPVPREHHDGSIHAAGAARA